MNILNIFHYSYYFDNYINPDFRFIWWLVSIFFVGIIVIIFLHIKFNKRFKKLNKFQRFWWAHGINMGYTITVTSLVHLFFRYQNIPYLNWRFWPALVVFGLIGWGIYLVYYSKKIYPQQVKERELRATQAKYFRHRR